MEAYVMPRDYGSHIEPLNLLAGCISDNVKNVVELGSGLYSTPMWCNRDLWPCVDSVISYENDDNWVGYFDKMFNEYAILLL